MFLANPMKLWYCAELWGRFIWLLKGGIGLIWQRRVNHSQKSGYEGTKDGNLQHCVCFDLVSSFPDEWCIILMLVIAMCWSWCQSQCFFVFFPYPHQVTCNLKMVVLKFGISIFRFPCVSFKGASLLMYNILYSWLYMYDYIYIYIYLQILYVYMHLLCISTCRNSPVCNVVAVVCINLLFLQ